jgi:hypothetical protein
MALLKSIATQYGIDANYWNIFSIHEDFKNKSIEVVINGFVTKENRDNDCDAIAWSNLTFSGDEYIKDVTREQIYLSLKAKDFVDSTDI